MARDCIICMPLATVKEHIYLPHQVQGMPPETAFLDGIGCEDLGGGSIQKHSCSRELVLQLLAFKTCSTILDRIIYMKQFLETDTQY